METKMFCMQCEQTAGGKACTNGGVLTVKPRESNEASGRAKS